jgi:hypothetical protein
MDPSLYEKDMQVLYASYGYLIAFWSFLNSTP